MDIISVLTIYFALFGMWVLGLSLIVGLVGAILGSGPIMHFLITCWLISGHVLFPFLWIGYPRPA